MLCDEPIADGDASRLLMQLIALIDAIHRDKQCVVLARAPERARPEVLPLKSIHPLTHLETSC